MVKMIIVWLLAALCTFNAVWMSLRSHFNAGHAVVWCCAAILIGYGLFHRQIDAFTATGFGRVLKILFFIGVGVYAALFVFVAVSGYSGRARGDEKAIIVLGAGIKGETVSDLLRRRLVKAQAEWEENPEALIVVTGGQGPGENIPEAVAMQRWLMANGVPEASILVEDKSTSTQENFTFAIPLLAEKGITQNAPVLVVTNAFHCYRAGQYAQKTGYANAECVPASMSPMVLFPSYAREVLAVLDLWVFKRNV